MTVPSYRSEADAEPGAGSAPLLKRLGLVVAGFCSLFIFFLLNWPDTSLAAGLGQPLLFLDTTPSGGDMGAHVWGPAFLRDHLLPELRLSGWTPDWYAGFPAYHFYMVVPSLAIVWLNAGLPLVIGVPLAVAVLAASYLWGRRMQTGRYWLMVAGIAAALLLVRMPYGVAFKLVSVSGLLFFPLAAWAMGRLARSPEPVPAFLALGAFFFLFDTNFNIYGGNIASTLAGEFAFSISLCLLLVAIGVAVRGMDDLKWRAGGAALIALVALCHLIPTFFIMPAIAVAVLSHPKIPRAWPLAATVALAIVPMSFADGRGAGIQALAVGAVVVVAVAAVVAEREAWNRAKWLLFAGPIAILLTAFWLMPFYLREPFFNDMGWERLDAVGAPMLTVPMKIALPVAALGFVMSYANRERIGMIFAATGVVFASAVANIGEGALWNARLLPFYYLSVYFLAAIGVAFAVRYIGAVIADDLHRPSRGVVSAAMLVALIAAVVAVSMPLRSLPGGHLSDSGDGSYRWLFFSNSARSFIPTWVDWNYSGYELKNSYREYAGVVEQMDRLGEENACGRAMWEYDKGLDRYGTPMALMLLPHWTDGCIGSMEGLYFESSATTPFHFLNQSVLSESPSRAQRDLPYLGFDINRGVGQLQVMGVRYYLAQTDSAIAAAREHPELTELAEAQPFVIFEVANSELVEALSVEPVIVSGLSEEQVAGDEEANKFDVGWVSQAVEYFNHPETYEALPAESGPSGWATQEVLASSDSSPLSPNEVSNIDVDTSRISFSVDKVGMPVLVKASYFPNWKVSGADGPWRVGPNLMAVVPTEQDVTLSYGRTLIDWGAILLTFAGLFGLGYFAVADRRRWRIAQDEPMERRAEWNERPIGATGGGLDAERIGPRWSPSHEPSVFEEEETAVAHEYSEEPEYSEGPECSEEPEYSEGPECSEEPEYSVASERLNGAEESATAVEADAAPSGGPDERTL